MKTKTLFQWHVWLGMATGVLMMIIGTSGAVAVFIEEIDWLVTPALRVPANTATGRADIDSVLANVKSAYPGGRVTALNVSDRPAFAHVAKVQVKERGNLDVFIDPATGVVRGDRDYSSAYTSTLRNFIRQLHLRLFMGLWGRVFVGVFGVTLVLSCITGLWIYRGWVKNLFRLRWKGSGERTRWSDLHKLVGVWSLVFNVMIGVTGAVFGLENLTNQVRSKWLRPNAEDGGGAQRAVGSKLPSASTALTADARLTVETLLAKAREAFPDLTVTGITFPTNVTAAVIFRGSVPSPLVQQSHVRSANFITLDPYSGAVVRKVDGREAK
ncbi:MAG TPA: PepSY-associated TM helix domain-containing protein, partial [Opitutaceae bacterium]|nr:PepSY-associated TM helix domain-containing protein [Opitutaceae bacterium]